MELVVTEFVSLDGVMEAPGGEPGYAHSGWVVPFMGPEQLAFKLREVEEADAHLLGRVTYESFAGAWPQRDGPFAEKVNAMPKHVVSTTLTRLGWENCHLIADDVVGRISALRAQPGGPLLVAGSRTLVHTLLAHDLVDELRLMTFPVVLGSGRRLFPERDRPLDLDLVACEALDTGVVVSRYRPARG